MDFTLSTEAIEQDLALLQEIEPNFAESVLAAIENNTLNMHQWNECVMGTIWNIYSNVREKFVEPDNLSETIAKLHVQRYGFYPEYPDAFERIGSSMTYMEVVAFDHEQEVIDALREALPKYVIQQ